MAHDTEKLRELLERVEKASGPDRLADLAIAEILDGIPVIPLGVPYYTASLDASIALVERKLPGWDWLVSLSELGGREFSAVVEHWDGDEYVSHRPTAPLAILSALLRALISQAEGEGA